ncbi:MAG: aldehyde dehydrogenase family protein [Actinobacteria bacterium]|nr:aldehyde dehydrogenase family protein [Cyanobacteriota bacterium]MCL5771930.1 aldehyde dehydrogenase family protein [Actinomycetota bacterium]
MKDYKLFIDNKWVDASDKNTTPVINPANGEIVANVAFATKEDVDMAIISAREAFDKGPWPKMSAMERGRILKKCADIIMRRLEEFALVETLNVGKPIIESRNLDIPMTADCFEYYGNLIVSVNGECIPVGPAALDYTLKEPIGVVGAITPWNFPVALAVRKIAPAIAAGNTMVIKPASFTPLTTIMLGEVFLEAGLPKGVVNIVPGSGSVTGEAIINSLLIDKFSFTGSKKIGSRVMEKASCCASSVSLELGGKAPAIVFKDADIDTTIKGILFGAFLNQGECCCAATRVLIDKSIHDRFMEKFVPAVESIRIGLPIEESTQMGPMITQSHQKEVLKYIEQGIKEGAKLVCGGKIPVDEELKDGFFIMPTIFDNVMPNMTIYREEIFGPVLVISIFKNEEELIEAANDTQFGLAASIFTENLRRGHVVARKLKAGTVWINIHNFVYSQAPYGGYKQSGIGRELGKEGIEEYMETKNVITYLDEKPFDWYK